MQTWLVRGFSRVQLQAMELAAQAAGLAQLALPVAATGHP